MSKLLRLEEARNLPPKSWAPSRANIDMKSKRRRSRLLIEDMLPSKELTSSDMDLQYLCKVSRYSKDPASPFFYFSKEE